ncbi:Lipopolysaccharide-modifying protein [Penicillium malachiteum]|uniref:Lipopolysaccharide-modifying protein n=1 Tax=Penicillium malachiteum TaxID=1324776 RepID=A0AAD6HNN8_9EURO|nr:Lipopolysaccharide-modifying protein [Penicillium malachiteum]
MERTSDFKSALLSPIRALYGTAVIIIGAISTGKWGQHRYELLESARQTSNSFYAQSNRRKFISIAGLVVVLVFLYNVLGIFGSSMPLDSLEARACQHPVAGLVLQARNAFNETLQTQSKTLEQAVVEYKRRYKMPPPPHFDEWYEFAKSRNTVLIDEFDTIYHTLLPFWGLKPSVIRSRVREDLGFVNKTFVMGISIRNGEVFDFGKGQGGFQREATVNILNKFVQWLPDMNLQFNAHDEPRVVVPHEQLNRFITKGREIQSRLNSHSEISSQFSPGDSDPILPVSMSRWINIEFQETWLHSRLSCPPESPAMALDGDAPDNTAAYAMEPWGFVVNQTAASDMCNSPSLRHRLGVFQRPNSFKLSNELVPMFSMSHPSSFQDIGIPSPFYYTGGASFDPESSVPWEEKKPQVYWRGRTTGGHSQGGSWRYLQRQRIIKALNKPQSPHHVMHQKSGAKCASKGHSNWELQEADESVNEYFNAHFTDIIDCDTDCTEEKEFFETVEKEPQSNAWQYKYLLDMDGHAYSGRFYAFLRSKSVPFKMTFFREWHENIVIPWVHYVPLHKDGIEIAELVRFFEEEPAGQEIAKSIGEDGSAWADLALRNEDIEVFMFRVMLE